MPSDFGFPRSKSLYNWRFDDSTYQFWRPSPLPTRISAVRVTSSHAPCRCTSSAIVDYVLEIQISSSAVQLTGYAATCGDAHLFWCVHFLDCLFLLCSWMSYVIQSVTLIGAWQLMSCSFVCSMNFSRSFPYNTDRINFSRFFHYNIDLLFFHVSFHITLTVLIFHVSFHITLTVLFCIRLIVDCQLYLTLWRLTTHIGAVPHR